MPLSHLYLLVFPAKSIIKIGKANDILRRLDTLRRWWGEVDYAASYYLAAEENLVYRLERSLHCLLEEYAEAVSDGEGKTELFRAAALEPALRHLDIYLAGKPPEQFKLIKGVELPVKASPVALSRPERNLKRFIVNGQRFFDSLDESNRHFKALHKLATFLVRRQDRICYQWDLINGEVAFRVKHVAFRGNAHASSVIGNFSFHIEDFNGYTGINCCSMVGVDDLTQFNIRLPRPDGERNGYLTYMLAQVENWISKLPRKSAATVEDLPILDPSKVHAEIWAAFEREGQSQGTPDESPLPSGGGGKAADPAGLF